MAERYAIYLLALNILLLAPVSLPPPRDAVVILEERKKNLMVDGFYLSYTVIIFSRIAFMVLFHIRILSGDAPQTTISDIMHVV